MAEREARQRQYDYRAVSYAADNPGVPILHGPVLLAARLLACVVRGICNQLSLLAELQLGADC